MRLHPLAVLPLLLCITGTASAVPSFARQTSMPCSACHTNYPELTEFGRVFKLNGYTLATGRQIQSGGAADKANLRIAEIPPLSAMVQLSATHMQKSDSANSQNNSIAFPQEASLFFAGAISEHLGAFVQVTYEQETGSFGWDNTDVRYANRTDGTVWGMTLNNNPSVQDLWNTTPAWGFPFAGSASANAPANATLIDGGLGGDVGGGGAYAMFKDHLYVELTGYRSAHQGTGSAAPTPADGNTISGIAPYWRLAWQQAIGSSYLMVGTYGLQASLFPAGIAGPTDVYRDYALDSQFETPIGANQLTLRGTWIHEKRSLDATFPAGAANASDTLNTWRVNGTFHVGAMSPALAYFRTSGTADATLYGTTTGKPDSSGEIVQFTYLPWQNVQATLQYVRYDKFDGARSNYDGTGRNAGDNDTLYALLWLMW